MAVTNELVKFLYGATGTPSTVAGEISFHSGNQAIYVGDGEKANLVTSSVKDATFANNVLTVTKIDGTSFTLNFTDVASAKETMAVFAALETSIKANATAIEGLAEDISELEAAYKLADTSIRTDFAAADASLKKAYEDADKAINEKIGGEFSATNTVAKAIEDAKAAAIAAGTIVAEDSEFITVETTGAAGKTQTYTIKTTNVAKADDLDDVSTLLNTVKGTAEAAATQVDFNAHATDKDIHITAQERTDWNAAKTAIDTFLKDAALTGDVIDTLTEIQDYIASDASAADKLVKDLSDVSTRAEKGITDAATAQAAADAAQGDVNALEGVVSTLSGNFDTHKNNTEIHVTTADKTKWNAAEQNAKNYADSLASNYDASGAAAGALNTAKAYADAIKVNGQAQTAQEITLTGVNIKVGGSGTNKDASLSVAVEDLYTKVQAASEAGVQSIAVNTEDANYAAVDKASGAVTFSIKTQDVSTAEAGKTGLVDALEAKNYVSFRIAGAKSDIIGTSADASTADTVYGAKAYAKAYTDAQVAAAALKWGELK